MSFILLLAKRIFDSNKLEEVVIRNSIKKIGRGTFLYNGLKKVRIPNHTVVHQEAFDENVRMVRY